MWRGFMAPEAYTLSAAVSAWAANKMPPPSEKPPLKRTTPIKNAALKVLAASFTQKKKRPKKRLFFLSNTFGACPHVDTFLYQLFLVPVPM